MKFESARRKVLGMCAKETTTSTTKELETQRMTPSPTPTPPRNGGVVKLTSTREAARQQHKTFPEQAPQKPHPSHYNTSPAAINDDTIETISPLSYSPPNGLTHISEADSPQFVRPVRRKSTIELHENPAYHPQGGPDYLKILAKYKLFLRDERHGGRIVCRFVNTGNAIARQPQIIPVKEYSANGNQEFLADIHVGDPPQRTYPPPFENVSDF